MKIWKWLFLLAKRKYRDAYLASYHNDIKCPGCKEWFSISGIEYKHSQETSDWGCYCTCGKCGVTSNWNCIAAPFPVLADADGNPK